MFSPPDAHTPDSSDALNALLHHAAWAPLDGIGWLRVTGDDRVRWLNGMVTNSIQSLQPGAGTYNFVLNAQGRIQGDCTAYCLHEAILLETASSQVEMLRAYFDRFIIMDDVEVAPIEAAWQGVEVAGPGAEACLEALTLPAAALDAMRLVTTTWRGHAVTLIHQASPLVPRFAVWGDAAAITTLTDAVKNQGAIAAHETARHILRVLEGTPLFGTDIRERDLPQETAPAGTSSRALHFSKGCYLGQEIVERIHSRGNLHRTFTGFVLAGEEVAPGTVLTTEDAPDKPVGELTSVARAGSQLLALGYVRRDAVERKARLFYPGGVAQPAPLPFPIS